MQWGDDMSDIKSKLTVISRAESPAKPVVNDELIQLLEQMLDGARSGEIVGIIGMLSYSDGSSQPSYSSGLDILRAIGMLGVLMRDLEDAYLGVE